MNCQKSIFKQSLVWANIAEEQKRQRQIKQEEERRLQQKAGTREIVRLDYDFNELDELL